MSTPTKNSRLENLAGSTKTAGKPKGKQPSHPRPARTIIVACIGAFAIILAAIIGIIPKLSHKPTVIILATAEPVSSVTPLPAIASAPTPIPTVAPRTGKAVNPDQPFSVVANYDPSGYIGDIGDISLSKTDEGVQFMYETNGLPSHEWEYKYEEGILNEKPAKFAGVIYLDPPNNHGDSPTGGYDLRPVSGSIHWDARSLQGDVYVGFFIGGIDWMWDEVNKIRVSSPYPDSLPRQSVGIKHVTGDWQTFEYNLNFIPKDSFRCVLGAFGWSIEWGAAHPPLYSIEVRNITYNR